MTPRVGRLLVLLGFVLSSATANAVVTLSVAPEVASPGGSVMATWSGIPNPTASNWLGLYTPGSPNSPFISFRYTNGAASGSLPFAIPGSLAPGTYQLRLFATNANSLLATSNNFVVGPSIGGTVTVGGAPLAGVAFAASNGGACTSSNASGQYSCAVPSGWSGSVTPSSSTHAFTPASRSYSNVTTNQTAQNYTASAVFHLTGRVTAVGASLPGVAFAAPGGGTCTNSNASGEYSCTVPQAWSGSVTPTLAPYAFTPASRSYSNVQANQAMQDYATVTVQVSGTVTIGASPLGGVGFAASGFGSCASSNPSGQYTCTVPQNWSGSITPSLSGYSFTPSSRSHSSLASNLTGQDFAATEGGGGTAAIYYIHVDHLNTPRLVANAAGTTVWRWDQQEPFGNNLPDENPSGLGVFELPLRLPGQYFDKETNLHYNYFRDYDPATGRYPQADPLGITTTSRPTPTMRLNHLYAYVDSNPLSWIDPLGLVKWSGQSKSFVWLAYSRDEFELESECKCGVKARIRVFVDSLGRGIGASAARSAIEFEDHFACPNPMAFAGPAVISSATAAVRFGASYSRAQVAAARSSGGWSAVEGLGASMGVSIGNARVPVEDIQFETCQCEKK